STVSHKMDDVITVLPDRGRNFLVRSTFDQNHLIFRRKSGHEQPVDRPAHVFPRHWSFLRGFGANEENFHRRFYYGGGLERAADGGDNPDDRSQRVRSGRALRILDVLPRNSEKRGPVTDDQQTHMVGVRHAAVKLSRIMCYEESKELLPEVREFLG